MSTKPTRKAAPTPKESKKPPPRALATNRRATFEYEILETYEAGLVLRGTEIKSLRAGRTSLAEAYARPDGGELWLYNMHIPPFGPGGPNQPSPIRRRKLLLHGWQLDALMGQAARKGLTIIPLRLYIKGHVAKVALALARGKRRYEKRQAILERVADREARRTLKRR
jgi:SsrA-binding protein